MIAAHIDAISRHASGVSRIVLALAGPLNHKAGQYIHIVHPCGTRIPLSIASAPRRLPALELHYRSTPGNPDAVLLNELLTDSTALQIEGPYGDVWVDGPCAVELWLIAGGTGIAQAFGIVEHLRGVAQRAHVHLLWSVTALDQLYCETELRDAPDWLDFHPLIDDPIQGNAVVQWLHRRDTPPPGGRIVLCGSPGFVYAVTDALDAIGTSAAVQQSDVFSYAPR
jgi:CDP-4-dehydro-6-deoxyglucose reductase, E3